MSLARRQQAGAGLTLQAVRREDGDMTFPPGRILLLMLAFLLAGLAGPLALWRAQPEGAMLIWTFDPRHAATYQQASGDQPPLLELHQARTGQQVQVQVMPSRVLDARLLSLTMGRAQGARVPDLVEIEIGSVGKFFREFTSGGGLLPLDAFIAADPLAADLSPARLRTWSHRGGIMGVPRDVHPVSLTYRDDLFRAAGIDLAACTTWPSFHQACQGFETYWRAQGIPRRAMQLARWSASDLLILLQQQGIELFDEDGRPQWVDHRIAPTIAFYVRMISGAEAISEPVPPAAMVRELGDGNTAALLTPDWRVDHLRWDPDLLGRLRMMPLPRFSADDAPTASWGGTMIAIPAGVSNPAAAWELLRTMHLGEEALHARQYHSDILPAITSAWDRAADAMPNVVYGSQHTARLYAELARELPEQRVSPYSLLAAQSLAGVLSKAQRWMALHGSDGLEQYCREQLEAEQRRLEKVVDFVEGPQ